MNSVSFNKSNVINRNNIVIQTNINLINITEPLIVKSEITNKIVEFRYNRHISEEQSMLNECWDGEESHVYFTDVEGKNIVLNLWDSPNFY